MLKKIMVRYFFHVSILQIAHHCQLLSMASYARRLEEAESRAWQRMVVVIMVMVLNDVFSQSENTMSQNTYGLRKLPVSLEILFMSYIRLTHNIYMILTVIENDTRKYCTR